MNPYHLISGVAGIALLTTGAYFVVSPTAHRVAETREANFAQIPTMDNTAVAPQEESNESTDDDYESEDAEENKKEQDDSLTAPSAPVSAEKQRIQVSPTPTPDTSKPPSPTSSGYTLTEVAKHADATSCWSVISGKVYDLTSFISRHPGGEKNILKICGKDGTNAFEGQHGGDSKPEKMLANLYLGALIQ